jgi:acyl carrier protein
MDEMMEYLDKSLPWIRPSDTGRSTNCLINQVGIYVHKKTRGYSNYAFPYSWDVRLGHKNRDAALEEINEELNEKEIYKIMSEIGYYEELETPEDFVLTVNYIGDKVDEEAIKNQLKEFLPPYLIPTKFIQLSEFPLTNNGKIDRKALEKIVHKATVNVNHENLFIAPDGPIEEVVAEIWQEVLNIDKISTNYKFLEIGGNSLAAIRINSRILESINLELPLAMIFEYPTIQEYASMIEKKIVEMMDE